MFLTVFPLVLEMPCKGLHRRNSPISRLGRQAGRACNPASASRSRSTSAASLYGGDRDPEQALPLPLADDHLDPVLVEEPALERVGIGGRDLGGPHLRRRRLATGGSRSWNEAASRRQRSRSSSGAPRSPPAQSEPQPDRGFLASHGARRSSSRRRSPTRSRAVRSTAGAPASPRGSRLPSAPRATCGSCPRRRRRPSSSRSSGSWPGTCAPSTIESTPASRAAAQISSTGKTSAVGEVMWLTETAFVLGPIAPASSSGSA